MKAGIYRNGNDLIHVSKIRDVTEMLQGQAVCYEKASERKGDAFFRGDIYTLFREPMPGLTPGEQLAIAEKYLPAADNNDRFETSIFPSAPQPINTISKFFAATKAAMEPPNTIVVQTKHEDFFVAEWDNKGRRANAYGTWRICHKQAARKHRRAGRIVRKTEDGRYVWCV